MAKFKQSPFVESVAIRAKYFPKNIWAVIFGEEKINWYDLYDRIKRLANAMKDKARVKKGDKVAFIFHNSPQFLEINFAAQMLGAIPVPVNYRYVPAEYEYTINDCDAAVVLCEDSVVDVIAETKPKLTKVRLFAADVENPPSGFLKYSDLIKYQKNKEIKIKCGDDDVGVIIYTGGTTGRSKGVMLTNRNLLTNQEAILRSFLTELPAFDPKNEKLSNSQGELKYLKAFDLFNSFFEGYFIKKPKDNLSVIMKGHDVVPDLSLVFAFKEGQLKIMHGLAEKKDAKLRIRINFKENFKTLLNMLPLAYSGKGRRKAMIKAVGWMLSRRFTVNVRLFRLSNLIGSLMKKSSKSDSTDRTQEFLSLLIVPPMFHLAAYAFFLTFSTYVGGMCVLSKERSFSPEDVLKNIDHHKPKWILQVPTMYRDIIDYIRKNPNHGYNLKSIRLCLSSASLLKAEEKKDILTLFPNSIVVDAFGQTEMAAISALKIDVDPACVKQGSVGKMGIGIEVKIVKDDGTPSIKDEEIGEIYYRSKTVMKGYYGDAEKTAKTIDKDGWLHSGDLGYLKNGELFTVDRKGECINSGGEKVFPIEIEEVLHEHPAIREVCIIGVPDEKWGNSVRAIVVLKEDQSCKEKDIIDWCQGKMAGYKKPRSVIFLDKLPINPVGKVMRGEIKKKYGTKIPSS